jgi:predicted amidohydrolase
MRIAAVQMEPKLGEIEHNCEVMVAFAGEAADAGARLVLFPECALQGYVFEGAEQAASAAVSRDHDAVRTLADLATRRGVALVFGFAERRERRERRERSFSNSVLVALPGGDHTLYRKTHLPMLGLDRWAVRGDELGPLFTFEGIRFGILVCYDLRYPEAARVLALAGADALLLPTNWPAGYEATADHAARTRAWENGVWLVAANRTGLEDDTRFIGRSLAVAPSGSLVASADGSAETMLLVEIDAASARTKTLQGHGGEQFDFFAARRPDLYGPLAGDPAR